MGPGDEDFYINDDEEHNYCDRSISLVEMVVAIRRCKERSWAEPDMIIDEVLCCACRGDLIVQFFVPFLSLLP